MSKIFRLIFVVLVMQISLLIWGDDRVNISEDLVAKMQEAKGELRIADTVRQEPLVRNVALLLAQVNPELNITITQTTFWEAIAEESVDSYDVIIFDQDPADGAKKITKKLATLYAIEPTLIYVNKDFILDNIAATALNDIYCGNSSDWMVLAGIDALIRAYGVCFPVIGERPFSSYVMGQLSYADTLGVFTSTKEVIAMVSGNRYAIGFGGYTAPDQLGDTKAIKVNGVSPDIDKIRSGKYPLLMNRYVAPTNDSSNAQLFIELLLCDSARSSIAKLGMIPPK